MHEHGDCGCCLCMKSLAGLCRDDDGKIATVVRQEMAGDACSMPPLTHMICTSATRASYDHTATVTTAVIRGGCS